MLLNFIHRLGIKSETIDLLSFLSKKRNGKDEKNEAKAGILLAFSKALW